MSAGSIQFTTELLNGANLTWRLSWEDSENYISLSHVNSIIDHLRREYTKPELEQDTDGRISSLFKKDGLKLVLEPISIGESYGSI